VEPTIEQAKEALRIEEFGVLYGISRAQVYKEIAGGRLIARKVGSRTLIRRQDADAWLRALPVMPPRADKAA
jgi:excisionase family DNA binding protein